MTAGSDYEAAVSAQLLRPITLAQVQELTAGRHETPPEVDVRDGDLSSDALRGLGEEAVLGVAAGAYR